ncbi:TRAP transporter large permease subunit [Pseudomonas stutzeri]|uniref:TRAP transporter large permease protein n=1 Tax=Stutzerimonas stutzeri KOS6 TaxID=1218352 RepID=A0A061JVC0_STUST|nr:TRAP transporter large permease [Stutzerimonas stutzeri]EWC42470.1 membrane protein [Stutzerimonas stutzeri KOS6]MBK3870197.1 TRAP transporter large permease subunit [Stutzerimonas stutzeri]
MLMFIALLVMLAFLAIGTHVAVALGLVTTGLILFVAGVPTTVIAQTAFKSVNSYPLMAIPMFVLAGNLMMRGNIAELLIQLVGSVVQAVRGGLALTAMIASVFFAAVSGSSVGSAAAIGASTVDGLTKENYPPRFSAAIVAVGGTLGLMIPPSLGFILIGSIVGLPVDQLFIAGVLPGLMEAGLLMVAVVFFCRRNGYGAKAKRADWAAFSRRLPGAGAALLMPVLILGSIYSGYLTPTEVSAFAAAYAAILCLLVYRSVTLGGVWDVARDSLLQTTMIFAVVMGGSLVGFALARMGVSASLVSAVSAMDLSIWQFLILVNILLLILGMFLDGIALIVLTAPLLFPIATHLGINPIHFAVIMVANVEIATLTPPIGLNLFVMAGISKLPVHEVARGVLPFYGVRLLGLALITFIPAISLTLVS